MARMTRHDPPASGRVWNRARLFGAAAIIAGLTLAGSSSTIRASVLPLHRAPTPDATHGTTTTNEPVTSLDGTWGASHAFPHRNVEWVAERAPLELVDLPAYFKSLPAHDPLTEADHQSVCEFNAMAAEHRAMFAALGADFRLHVLTNVGLLEATHVASAQLLLSTVCPDAAHDVSESARPPLDALDSEHRALLDRGRRSPVSALLAGEELEREELAFVRDHPSVVPEIAVTYALVEKHEAAQMHSIDLHLGVARADARARLLDPLRPDLAPRATFT